MDKLIEMFKKLPETCVEEVAKSCLDIVECHLKLLEMFNKCIYCGKEPHICEGDICECWIEREKWF